METNQPLTSHAYDGPEILNEEEKKKKKKTEREEKPPHGRLWMVHMT